MFVLCFKGIFKNKKIPAKYVKHVICRVLPLVEATGLEPTASASRTRRSTKLSHASIYYI